MIESEYEPLADDMRKRWKYDGRQLAVIRKACLYASATDLDEAINRLIAARTRFRPEPGAVIEMLRSVAAERNAGPAPSAEPYVRPTDEQLALVRKVCRTLCTTTDPMERAAAYMLMFKRGPEVGLDLTPEALREYEARAEHWQKVADGKRKTTSPGDAAPNVQAVVGPEPMTMPDDEIPFGLWFSLGITLISLWGMMA